jgi:hypothetical protein
MHIPGVPELFKELTQGTTAHRLVNLAIEHISIPLAKHIVISRISPSVFRNAGDTTIQSSYRFLESPYLFVPDIFRVFLIHVSFFT